MSKKLVLFVNNSRARCGVHSFGKELIEQLSGSTIFSFEEIECGDLSGYVAALKDRSPAAVIFNYHPMTMSWAPFATALGLEIPTVGVLHDVTDEIADAWPDTSFDVFITHDPFLRTSNPHFVSAPRPIPQYEPKAQPPSDGIVRIGSFGFAAPDKGFEQLVATAQSTFDRCLIRLHVPPSDYIDPEGSGALAVVERCRSVVNRPGIDIEASHEFMERDALIEFLASNDLNALFYEPRRGNGGISSAGDWLLACRRPVALRRGAMFRNFDSAKPSIFIDDLSLQSIYDNGTAPLEVFRSLWTPSGVIKSYERAIHQAALRHANYGDRRARQVAVLEAGISALEDVLKEQTLRIRELEHAFHLLEDQKRRDAQQIEVLSKHR